MSYQRQQGMPASLALVGEAPSDSEPAASRQEIEEAVLSIRQSALIQIERIQAYTDAAQLAVEQVQDTRFRLLGERLNASGSDIFLAAVMTGLLESSFGGMVVAALARRATRLMLRLNKLFHAGERRKIADMLKAERQKLRSENRSWMLKFSRGVYLDLQKPNDVSNLRRYAEALVRGAPAPTPNAVVFAKATWAAIDKWKGNQEVVIDPEDCASVNVLAAAQQYASSHRFVTLFHAAHMESVVRSGEFSKETLDMLLEYLSPGEFELSLGEARRKFKLFFEAVIWSKLYGFDRAGGVGIKHAGWAIDRVEKQVLEYWFVRFGQQIEEWSQGNPEGTPGWGNLAKIVPLRDGDFASLDGRLRISHVYQYLTAVGKAVPEDPAAFKWKNEK